MTILEVSDDGLLHIPGKFLTGVHPHEKFELDVLGNILLLRPVDTPHPFWQQATPSERANAFERWAITSPPHAPDLSDESLHREKLHD